MKLTLSVIVVSCVSTTAFAGEEIFDVRTAYMGGAGIAGQRATAGIQLNPANLAMPGPKDTWGLTLPVVSAGAADPYDLKGSVNNIQNIDINQVNNDISALQNFGTATLSDGSPNPAYNPAALITPNSAASPYFKDLASIATNLSTDLKEANGDQVFGNAGAGVGLAIPGKSLGFGLDVKASVQLVGQDTISSQDLSLLNDMSTVFGKGYVTLADRVQFPQLFGSGFSPANYQSTSYGTLVGLGMGEVGFSFAHQYVTDNGQILALGIKPKILDLRTFDYSQFFSSTGGFKAANFRNNETSTTMLNADAGLTLEVAPGWRIAGTVDNIVKKNLVTTTGRNIGLEPKWTGGIAYDSRFFNWSLDVDANKQTSLGFNSNSQIIATGVELNAWNVFRIGAGFRHNLVSGSIIRDVATAGISTSALGLNLGLAAYGRPHEVGGAFQLSLEY